MVTDTWASLSRELDAWSAAGLKANFWWRDDDTAQDVDPLQKLLHLQQQSGVPLALAAIGGEASKAMAARVNQAINDGREIYLLSHGYRHENHAREGEKKNEFPNHRLAYDMLADIALGFEGLKVLFANRALPVFVPPWNRFAPGMVPRLRNAQIRGFSSYGTGSDLDEFALTQANCQVDIIAWRGARGFVGEEAAIQQIVEALGQRRQGGENGPVGILSHHLDHDNDCWQFLDRLFQLTAAHDAARWQNPLEVFNLTP